MSIACASSVFLSSYRLKHAFEPVSMSIFLELFFIKTFCALSIGNYFFIFTMIRNFFIISLKSLHSIVVKTTYWCLQCSAYSRAALLFEGGAYLKGSYHKDKTFLIEQFYSRHEYFSWLTGLKN